MTTHQTETAEGMTPTPRTDAEIRRCGWPSFYLDFARQLEQELASARAEVERLREFETAYHRANGYNDTPKNLEDWIADLIPEITRCRLSERSVIEQVQDLHAARRDAEAKVEEMRGACERFIAIASSPEERKKVTLTWLLQNTVAEMHQALSTTTPGISRVAEEEDDKEDSWNDQL